MIPEIVNIPLTHPPIAKNRQGLKVNFIKTFKRRFSSISYYSCVRACANRFSVIASSVSMGFGEIISENLAKLFAPFRSQPLFRD